MNPNKVYECTKEFELSEWDSDNDCFSDETMDVKINSKWVTSSESIIGGEIRLESLDTDNWIEISKATLEECFKDITL